MEVILPSHMGGVELLFLWIFSLLSPSSNLVERMLPFLYGLHSHSFRLSQVKHMVTIICADQAE